MKGLTGPGAEDLQYLYNPDWTRLTSGSRVSVVVTDLIWQGLTCVGKLCPGEQRVRVVGCFPPEACGFPTLALLDAVFLDFSGLVDLSVDESSCVLCHGPPQVSHVQSYIEVCSGAGFSGLGFKHAGFHPKCAVELQPKLAELHRSIHPGIPVINADITDDRTAALIHQVCPEPTTLMAGIACQPYSRAGKQDGGSDVRAATLPATLRLAIFLQSPTLVLECVAAARSNEYVLAHIRELESQMGFHVVDCCMKLEEVWSGMRYRWWLIATHRRLGRVLVPSFPKGSPLVVRDLMPYTKRWSDEDEAQLALTQQEIERFQLGGEPLRKYVVQPDQKLPTALHSWGGQTQACACECRPQGFADLTLQSRGLFAQLLQIPGLSNQIKYRHMHACEVAIHNGVPPLQQWSSDARLNLCAVGQLASPFHATWVATAILAHVQKLFGHGAPLEPLRSLSSLKHVVLQQSKELFPAIPRAVQLPTEEPSAPLGFASPSGKPQVEVSDNVGATVTIMHQPDSTVRHLLEAECDLMHVPLYEVQVCTMDGVALPADARLCEHKAILLKKHGFEPPTCAQPDPEVPFMPEDMVPYQPEDVVAMNAPAGDVATQVDSDVDMSCHDHVAPMPIEHVSVPTTVPPTVLSDESVQALLQLSTSGLLAMVPPLAPDVKLCATLRSQRVSWTFRDQLLTNQAHVWADDELLWHIQATVMYAQKNCSSP